MRRMQLDRPGNAHAWWLRGAVALCATLTMAVELRAADVGGVVRSISGDAVSDTVISVTAGAASPVSTDSGGAYTLRNISQGDVDLVATKIGDTRNAISAIDAVWALQAVVGLRELNAQERLACDVNGSGTLTAIDAVLILQWAVGLIARFPVAVSCASDWLFFPAPDPPGEARDPSTSGMCGLGAILYRPLSSDLSNQNFTARLIGDCNGSWRAATPTASPSATVTSSATASATSTSTPTASSTSSPTISSSPTRTVTPPAPATFTATRTVTATRSATRSATRTATATLTPTPLPTSSGNAPSLGGCNIFPADNWWNRDVSGDPVDASSDTYIAYINALGAQFLHADFGSYTGYGIPYVVVPQSQPMVPITFVDYGDESDPGPYPVPATAPVEAGSDHHVLVLQQGVCKLYELYNASKHTADSGWDASSGAIFDLSSNALRPPSWTSADAAGLPILPGLVRYDEVTAGEIRHALRFTIGRAQRAWVQPATHYGNTADSHYPPMGTRFRLKQTYDIGAFTGQARVVLEALRRYGMFVSDHGTNWYITGATDARWNDEDLDQLKTVPSTAFEVVRLGTIYYP